MPCSIPFQGYDNVTSLPPPKPLLDTLINIHTLSPQIRPRQINLLHKLRVRLGYIVECEDAVSEFEEEVCAEGNEGPERKLFIKHLAVVQGFKKDKGREGLEVWEEEFLMSS
jgi:hypothetical protein